MIRLNFTYDQNYQFQRVVWTIKRFDWYIKYYDTNKILLPDKMDRRKVQEYSEAEILDFIAEEYSDEKYKNVENYINNNWVKVYNRLEEVFGKLKLDFPKDLEIFLTKYGVGGSYSLPNTIVINVEKCFNIGLLSNIAHEFTHLTLEKLIQNYSVEQQPKERLVDLFMSKHFSDIFPHQKNITQQVYSKINIQKIDDIFNQFYPDIQTVVRKVGELGAEGLD